MPAIGSKDVAAPLKGQQVVFGHHAGHPFVIDHPALVSQVSLHPAIPVAAAMSQNDLLDPHPQFHLFGLRLPLLPITIEAGAADASHTTHRLDTGVCLPLLYFPDFFVDAVAPQPSLARSEEHTSELQSHVN